MPSPATLAQRSVHYLRKNYRYLVEDPSFFWMKTVARFEFAREIVKRASLTPAPPAPPSGGKMRVSADHGVERALATLEDEGYYVGLRLAKGALRGLLKRTREATCYADRDPTLPFRIDERSEAERRYERRFKLGSYRSQQDEWPEFWTVRDDPTLETIARNYLGCTPVYLRSELLWTFPRVVTLEERIANAQVFHCDINDFRTVKFFFYLTEVGPGGGPHTYIKKSSRQRTIVHQLLGQRCASIPDELLEETYGSDQIVTIYGPPGLGFVGDPYYFHRGTPPTVHPRLLLQLEMGCKRYRTWYFKDAQ